MSDQETVSVAFVIMNPLTKTPMKKTPEGVSLEGVTFPTKEELEKLVRQHWRNPVFMTDGKVLQPLD